MKSAQALTRSLVLDMRVAWRVLCLCRLGKQCPDLPASVLYSPEELAILEVLKKNAPARRFPAWSTPKFRRGPNGSAARN